MLHGTPPRARAGYRDGMAKRGAQRQAPQPTLSLHEAARRIGLEAAELADVIREAGVAPAGPEVEWRLEARDVDALQAERLKGAQRNRRELERLGDALPEE